MNISECISQLENLQDYCIQSGLREGQAWDKDIETLDTAISILKETDPECKVQEQKDNIYPSKMTLVDAIGSGTYVSNGIIYDSSTALTIEVLIDRNIYDKKDVYKAIKKVYGKLLQYFF